MKKKKKIVKEIITTFYNDIYNKKFTFKKMEFYKKKRENSKVC